MQQKVGLVLFYFNLIDLLVEQFTHMTEEIYFSLLYMFETVFKKDLEQK